MEIIGELKVKFNTQKVSEKFQKREFVLTTEGNTPYPQHVQFQLTQDKVALLDNIAPGDDVKVQFNLRGREWNGPQGIKYYNTLDAWRIELVSANGGQNTTNSTLATTSGMSQNVNTINTNAADNSDLPF